MGDAATHCRIGRVWGPVVFVAPEAFGFGLDRTGDLGAHLWWQVAAEAQHAVAGGGPREAAFRVLAGGQPGAVEVSVVVCLPATHAGLEVVDAV